MRLFIEIKSIANFFVWKKKQTLSLNEIEMLFLVKIT